MCFTSQVSKDRVILAEFGYDGKVMETFDRNTGKFPLSLLGQEGYIQETLFAFMKKHIFPLAYWHLYPRGYWYGTDTIFRPDVTKTKKDEGDVKNTSAVK